MQVAAFSVAALHSGSWCLRWVMAGGEERVMRARLGLFSGLVCVGSVDGAVSFGTTLPYQNLLDESNSASVSSQQNHALAASSSRFAAVNLITYGFELLCLILSKLVLLRLLVDSATQSSQADVSGMSGVRRR